MHHRAADEGRKIHQRPCCLEESLENSAGKYEDELDSHEEEHETDDQSRELETSGRRNMWVAI